MFGIGYYPLPPVPPPPDGRPRELTPAQVAAYVKLRQAGRIGVVFCDDFAYSISHRVINAYASRRSIALAALVSLIERLEREVVA